MNTEKLRVLYKKYELSTEDVFKHQHYVILTRSGIEKIKATENINIHYVRHVSSVTNVIFML